MQKRSIIPLDKIQVPWESGSKKMYSILIQIETIPREENAQQTLATHIERNFLMKGGLRYGQYSH